MSVDELTEAEEFFDFGPEDTPAFSRQFAWGLVERCLLFLEELCETKLYRYQKEIAGRVLFSLIYGDGEELTVLVARQAGKTESVADAIATAMILLPRLAQMFPGNPVLEKFKNGLWVGVFAPTEQQARDLLFARIVSRLTSDHATEILQDDDIDDETSGGGRVLTLKRCGSMCRWQTANPRAKIEGTSYHLIVIDEAQDADSEVIRKSIVPMGTAYNASRVLIGTPTTQKGEFYSAIQRNKRRQTTRNKTHFEYNWRACAAERPYYKQAIKNEMARLGADSDEFMLAYEIKWLLDRGMLVTDDDMEIMGDRTMDIVRTWTASPVLVGIDTARRLDSTVVTILYVDWENPDEFGMYDVRILDWLEIHGDNWESQYAQMCSFVQPYWVMAIGIDAQGGGSNVAERLEVLLPNTPIVQMRSNPVDQSERWKFLIQYLQKRKLGWPAASNVRKLARYRHFTQQMVDVEKKYQSAYIVVENPDKKGHDDYVDSLSIALYLLKEVGKGDDTIEVFENPFYGR